MKSQKGKFRSIVTSNRDEKKVSGIILGIWVSLFLISIRFPRVKIVSYIYASKSTSHSSFESSCLHVWMIAVEAIWMPLVWLVVDRSCRALNSWQEFVEVKTFSSLYSCKQLNQNCWSFKWLGGITVGKIPDKVAEEMKGGM